MISLGADVSEQKIDLCFYDCDQQKILFETQILNHSKGFKSLEKKLTEFNVKRLLVESTGGLEQAFCFHFQSRVQELLILNPKQVKRFKEACFQDQKTDRIDAQVLAHMAILHSLPKPKKLTQEERELASLLSARIFCVKQRTASILRKSRLSKQIIHPFALKQLEKQIKHIDQDLVEIERLILDQINRQVETQKSFARLQTIPGVGIKTAMALIQSLGATGERFQHAEKFCAFAGLYPQKHESGKMKGAERLTRKGCRQLRGALYLGALSTITGKAKTNPWKKYYEYKKEQGKKPKQILIAIAHKMARAAWFVVNRGWSFDSSKAMPHLA